MKKTEYIKQSELEKEIYENLNKNEKTKAITLSFIFGCCSFLAFYFLVDLSIWAPPLLLVLLLIHSQIKSLLKNSDYHLKHSLYDRDSNQC